MPEPPACRSLINKRWPALFVSQGKEVARPEFVLAPGEGKILLATESQLP
jgi:hypothetical protein